MDVSTQRTGGTQLSTVTRRVLFEGHNLALQQGTGIMTYARGLVAAAGALGFESEVLVGTNRRFPKNDPQLAEVILFDGPRNYNLIHQAELELRRAFGAPLGITPGVLEGLRGAVVAPSENFKDFKRIHAVARLIEVERLHFMRYGKRLRLKMADAPPIFHATRPAPIELVGAANLYTVHDIVPLRLPYTTADDKAYYIAMLRDLVRVADHIVTVSEFSRRDIIEFTRMPPDRITNAYQAVAFPDDMLARSHEQVAKALRERHGLKFKEYFLFVGAIEPKKNLTRLIDAYAASGVRRPLVIAGGAGWMNERDFARINSERFLSYTVEGRRVVPARAVKHLSYLPLADIVDLLRGARALLYPSIYEGFGLPAAEAMLVGTPVLTSNVASLPETTGGNALLVDPYDVDDIAKGIRTLDADDDMTAELGRKGPEQAARFSPSKFAERLAAIYGSVTG